MRLARLAYGCVLFVSIVSQLRAAENGRHVVVVTWDGLRPDSINKDDTPNLYKLSKEGVWFKDNHSSIITSTEVNGTVLATGCFPEHSTLIANREYRPNIDPLKSIATEGVDLIRKADKSPQGPYLKVPTIAETLQKEKLKTEVACSKSVAFLFDRSERPDAGGDACCANLFIGQTLPPGLVKALELEQGTFPPVADSTKEANLKQDRWTTRAFIEKLTSGTWPSYAVLWLSEVDYAQHGSGPGSEPAQSGLKNCDECLGLVIKTLKDRGLLQSTDIIVVSDHGFSTISEVIELPDLLNQNGFHAVREWKSTPEKNDIMVISLGGSVLLYVIDHDPETVGKLAAFLQRQPFTSNLFSKTPLPGTFPLSTVHLNSPEAPDLVLGLRWSKEKSATGKPGLIISESSKRKVGQGNHASFSPFDIHNTLVACGPDFKKGWEDSLPTGNIDIVPTVLSILGIQPATALDGRVLSEAMSGKEAKDVKVDKKKVKVSLKVDGKKWEQYLKIKTLDNAVYIDEGTRN